MNSTDRTISAGEFKTHCLRLMDEVAKHGTSLVVTKRGKPVVKLVAVEAPSIEPFGCMAGTIEIVGDILAPLDIEWTADEENVRDRDR